MKTRFFACLILGLLVLWAGSAWAVPKAQVPNPRYEFPPMSEGKQLTHEFIIKNSGDTELNILSVLPP